MKKYLKHDEWKIVEDKFYPEYNRISESIFSLGNGHTGQRGNFEEQYSGDSLLGNYVGGVYYPDKTKVGWWKNGYPEYFAKVLNAPNWIGIDVKIDGELVDLAKGDVLSFNRVLNMKEGFLLRSFVLKLPSGKLIQVESKRFISYSNKHLGLIRYSITPMSFNGQVTLIPYIDADIANEDSNYDEKFWNEIQKKSDKGEAYIITETKKTGFWVGIGMKYQVTLNNREIKYNTQPIEKPKYVGNIIDIKMNSGDNLVIYKYVGIVSSLDFEKEEIREITVKETRAAYTRGFDELFSDHVKAWDKKWEESDIVIKGDIEAQQGIRFNIFQLYQTYTGDDARLNIGPKGFTGEKYGGSTYWDTEAYCFPFYLSTAGQEVARNLLLYRYKQLPKAIENAQKLGFNRRAALYPMVTMNGEECHNEWEITFEEIHRNGAIAYAIYRYVNYTGDKQYLIDYGLEVLIAISRFWAQRVNYSKQKNKYVMLGVTGPNEYENNVNNNWYTNTLAVWTLKYTLEAIAYVEKQNEQKFISLLQKVMFDFDKESEKWTDIINNMYFPYDPEEEVFIQQDGFLDKEIIKVKDLDQKELPINQNWSWDRILRSCFIKQADVLQGLYFFENDHDEATLKRNFDFYEPLTVHESSLSPCVHSILASKLRYEDKAYELYLRTSRLDLDDYNNDTEDGCHITSMAGTWMAIVEGFAGMRIKNGELEFNPYLPAKWDSYSFKIRFRNNLLKIVVKKTGVEISNLTQYDIRLIVFSKQIDVRGMKTLSVKS
ncbi:MAG: glycoside hydrolase family 65 protein [Bacteroidales bacterium]|nr:glycoside hydrolase family 65 protein [Bacteroidales bacterium]